MLDAFRTYLEGRRKEIARALTPGQGLDTWDPFLNGFGQGVQCGLEIAEGLVYSYLEWAARGTHNPDAGPSEIMDH